MEQNRYYWLKFPKDFFASKRIKKLRSLAGGDTFTIIYLKMQLKSLATGGILEYTGIENSFAEEIALDIDEGSENVGVTINYLLSCGLMEKVDEKHLLLPYVLENTGSETASAQRGKEYRASLTDEQKESERERAREGMRKLRLERKNVTDVTNGYEQVTNGEIEKEKEKEKELEIEKDKKSILLYFPNDEELNSAFKDFVENRKKLKKPMTQKAIDLAMAKLNQLSGFNSKTAIEIINQSIINGWAGLFPLNEKKKGIDWDNV